MNKSLQAIQADFQDYILASHAQSAADAHTAPAIAQSIQNQFGLHAADRLAIYHNAYRARLREALSEAFEKTHVYLGDELFEQMGDHYVQQHPSTVRNMRWYGADFPAYLAHTLEEHPIVAELAAFEWALGLAFDATDAPSLGMDDMRTLAPAQWETLSFVLHPSLQLLRMHCNAVETWLALDQENEPPAAVAAQESACWLVWRKQLQPHFRSLDSYETLALEGLRQGRSFSDVCEQAVKAAAVMAGGQDITPKIAGWLQGWTNDAILTRIVP